MAALAPLADLAERAAHAAIPRRRRRRGLLGWLLRESVALDHHIREGRFQRSLALIAGVSSLLGGLEVTYEHYQGSYGQRIMYSPVMITPLVFIAGVWGTFNRRVARTLLPLSSLVLLGDGMLGFFFHIRGIARKPGGWRIPVFNVVMGPPLFAPLLLGIGGFLGVIASLLRREDDTDSAIPGMPKHRSAVLELLPRKLTREGLALEQHVREGRFQKILAIATAVSGLLNGIEALYAHYKNNFAYRIQWSPIILSPALVIAGIGGAMNKTIAKTMLPIISLLAIINGLVGFVMHARGVARRPGGLHKPLYNVIYGPPIFAPLLFAASGFLGLLASLLRRAD